MNLKKLTTMLLALVLLLSSCGRNNQTNAGESENGGNNAGVSETLPDNGTGTENGNTGTNENNTDNEDTGASAVTKVESADDAISFIEANVYSRCPDVLPMMVMTTALTMEDMDSITYNTGLTDTSGITDVILSESGVGSIAYSLVYLRTDGSNTAEIQTSLGESINPSKWICVTAESIASVTLDNDIILVMGSKDQVNTILNAVTEAAEGVYETVGSIVTFS
ncbi:MAG: hypothetical protein ACI4V1_00380 [Eubacteriales bacterium]